MQHKGRFLEPYQGFKIIHYVQYHKESGLRGQMVVCGLDESVDNALIGYSDPKFEFYSPLNEENQQKIHDYIDRQGLSDRNVPVCWQISILSGQSGRERSGNP